MKVDLVICAPGSSFSAKNKISFNRLLSTLHTFGVKGYMERNGSGSNVYDSRNICLSSLPYVHQMPFGDAGIDSYGHMLWIDSDQTFEPSDFGLLWEHRDIDIVSGWYRMKPGPGESFDENNKTACGYLRRQGVDPRALTVGQIEKARGLIEVEYCGMGFMLIKQGVAESLEYPWFQGWVEKFTDDKGILCAEHISDDTGFMIRAQKAGFKIMVDPRVRVGHLKETEI